MIYPKIQNGVRFYIAFYIQKCYMGYTIKVNWCFYKKEHHENLYLCFCLTTWANCAARQLVKKPIVVLEHFSVVRMLLKHSKR